MDLRDRDRRAGGQITPIDARVQRADQLRMGKGLFAEQFDNVFEVLGTGKSRAMSSAVIVYPVIAGGVMRRAALV